MPGNGGEVMGEGSGIIESEPRGKRGLGILSGDAGPIDVRDGEGWR